MSPHGTARVDHVVTSGIFGLHGDVLEAGDDEEVPADDDDLVPHRVVPHRAFPPGEDRTVVECDRLYAPEGVASGADVTKSVELLPRVDAQDPEARERTRPATASRAYRAGSVPVPAEHRTGIFHEWLLQQPGGDGHAGPVH
ncbi:hypothetical protein GCM10010377_63980 [Streptomyces viridiviolaceus]|uniref:SRPBCC family protein n=1 Tax=Streptomyces viridiviolaceus TaxID=68282 RepID=A0ABW2E2X1_9ACTN|nr:hypothetical protein GCM10010377_63980 [Streptomyces viridiviolaceus]